MLVFHMAVTVALVVVCATALAHALEMPGKARLPRETYLAVQRIYYPGFTVVGWAEPLVVVGSVVSAVLTTTGAGPSGLPSGLRWAAAALAAIAHGVYWFVVHPTNRQWSDPHLDPASTAFFAVGAVEGEWVTQRRGWERGHLARCLLLVPAVIASIGARAVG